MIKKTNLIQIDIESHADLFDDYNDFKVKTNMRKLLMRLGVKSAKRIEHLIFDSLGYDYDLKSLVEKYGLK